MKLKLLLVTFCLLAMMLPFGNHHEHILSLSEFTAPDVNTSITLELACPSFTLAPAPTPLPRYSPLVVPVHFTVTIKKPRPSRYDRSTRVTGIQKLVRAIIARMREFTRHSHPTRTSQTPTKVFVPAPTAPPSPAHHSFDDIPTYNRARSSIEQVGLWDGYKLVVAWMAMICASIVYALVFRFTRDYSTIRQGLEDDVSVPEAPQPVFESIIDIYCALGFPPVADPNTPYDADLSNRGSSTPEDDLHSETDGSSEPTSVSASDKTLEAAVPSRSIGSLGHYSDDSLWITPSSSRSSIAQSPEKLLARFPPSGQVHSPQRKAWLQAMITRLQEMQRQGDHYGRVYDGYPELEVSLPATPDIGGSIASAGFTTPSLLSEHGTPLLSSAPAPFESGLDSMAEHTPSASLAVGGLSTTVSQDMLYDQIGSLVDYASELGDDKDAKCEEGQAGMGVGDDSDVSPTGDPSNIPLPPSPYVESPSMIVGGIVNEIDELLSMWGK